MRQDPQVHSFILAAREREKHSACCVRNDRSGCVQTSKEECSVGVLAPALSELPILISDLGLTTSLLCLLAVCGTSLGPSHLALHTLFL